MSLKASERKTLKDKIESQELGRVIDKITAKGVDKAGKDKPRVKRKK